MISNSGGFSVGMQDIVFIHYIKISSYFTHLSNTCAVTVLSYTCAVSVLSYTCAVSVLSYTCAVSVLSYTCAVSYATPTLSQSDFFLQLSSIVMSI